MNINFFLTKQPLNIISKTETCIMQIFLTKMKNRKFLALHKES